MSEKVGLYFWDKLPPALDRQENLRLLKEYKETGGQKIKDKIFYGNLRLVTDCVKNWGNLVNRECAAYPTLEDLYEMGALVLLEAIDSFNLKRDVKFATYAINIINNELGMLFRKLTRDKVIQPQIVDSLNKLVESKGENLKLQDQLCASRRLEDEIVDLIDDDITNAIKNLNPSYRDLLEQRYYCDVPQKDIAQKCGVTEATISQKMKRARNKLKKILENQKDFDK